MRVIAEFNPFHQGHAYLLEQARRKTGGDVHCCGDERQLGYNGRTCYRTEMEPRKVAFKTEPMLYRDADYGELPS